jgi:hypothetical protein
MNVQILDRIPEEPSLRIRGLDRLTREELKNELAAGGRFVFFEYCISLLIVSLRRPSDIYYLRNNESSLVRGLPYTLVSLLFGWWGLPWGIIYTPLAILSNSSGGCNVTTEVWALLQQSEEPMSEPTA